MEQEFNSGAAKIQEQINYYNDLAPNYDSFAVDNSFKGIKFKELVLNCLEKKGQCLEIASGTGVWTVILEKMNHSVIAVDSSENMHEIAKRKYGKRSVVKQVKEDIFSFETELSFDLIFSAFWISHVPEIHFLEFWLKIFGWLRRNGQVLFLDSYSNSSATSGSVRYIKNRKYHIIKNDFDFDVLIEILGKIGFDAKIFFPSPFTYIISASKKEISRNTNLEIDISSVFLSPD